MVSKLLLFHLMIRLRWPLSTLRLLSGPIEMLILDASSSLLPLRFELLWPPRLSLLSGWMTSHVWPPLSSSCCMSWSCGPFRPVGLGALAEGGGGKRVLYLVTFRGSVAIAGGSGRDSISVTLSRGRVDRRAAGRSTGEHPTMTCRRWVFEV